ncbi:MAG: hypothetical protein AAF501_08570 [Pseudomonadota bacterium]
MRKTAFLHVPKCAGTSVRDACIDALQPRHVIRDVFDPRIFGSEDVIANLPEPTRRQLITERPGDAADLDFVSGHIFLSTLTMYFPDLDHFTILREPRCHLLSRWLFWRQNFRHRDMGSDEWGRRAQASTASFAGFLTAENISCATDNLITRMLVSPSALIRDDRFIQPENDNAILRIAARNLR